MTNFTHITLDKDSKGFFAVIENIDGEIFIHPHRFDSEFIADLFIMKVIIRGIVDFSNWYYARTVYGSKAYQDNNLEMVI